MTGRARARWAYGDSVGAVDARLRSALEVQLRNREAALRRGAVHVGWKVGAGRRERIGGMVLGHLTSATQLRHGDGYRPGHGEATHADAELAVVTGAGGAISGYAAALELCDLSWPHEPEEIVAHNVWHRAFTLGPILPGLGAVTGRLVIGSERVAEAPIPDDVPERVERVAELLDAVGERLRAGEVIITGSVVQAPVRPGDHVRAGFPGLGRARLRIEAPGAQP